MDFIKLAESPKVVKEKSAKLPKVHPQKTAESPKAVVPKLAVEEQFTLAKEKDLVNR